MKLRPKHIRSFWSKKNILLVSLCVILIATAGLTVAWLTEYDTVNFEFPGARVDCQVTETFNGTEKSNVKIQNTGSVDAYFRATYTVNWVKDGTGVNTVAPVMYPTAPKEGVDYTLSVNQNDWSVMGDGYWYRVTNRQFITVKAGETSPVFITTLTDKQTAPEGYHLQVNVLAEAIQSTNSDTEPAFMDTWYETYQYSQSTPTPAS